MPRAIRLQQFLTNRSSGAAELAVQATRILDRADADEIPAAELVRLRQRIIRAHPAMGAVWNAVHTTDREAFRCRLGASRAIIRRAFRQRLRRRAVVLTLSYSSTVLDALRRRDLTVWVAESLPGGEGRRTVRRLRQGGVNARVTPDSSLAQLTATAHLAVVGADAVTSDTVVNKVGTHILALIAQDRGIPCYVLADSSKWVEPGWEVPPYSARHPFEATPRRLFAEIISDGVESLPPEG